MQPAELTLAAAIRDANHRKGEVRNKAVRNLGLALLEDLGKPGPRWRATHEHDRGPEVLAALKRALDDDDAMIRGLAAIGLGLVGEPEAVAWVAPFADIEGTEPDAVFRRECGLIALSFIGSAAPANAEGAKTKDEVLVHLRAALRSPLPDLRFQAAVALVEVAERGAEAELVGALESEDHPGVRENLVAALSRLDPPGEAACSAFARIVADPDQFGDAIGFEAAMALAGARLPEAGDRLVYALDHRGERDRALEALAALGRAAPPAALERTVRLARAWLTPGITRVRAAYALARMIASDNADQNEGLLLLRRLAWHPRPAVREAVADAYKALGTLER